MSKSQGNVIDPWTIFDDLRRRRAALVLLLRRLSRGRRGACPRRASTSRPARRCSRSGTCSRSSSPTPTSTAGRPTASRRRARRTCSTAGSLGELDDTVAAVTDALEQLRRAHRGRPGSAAFVDDLSNWYVRRSAGRGSGRLATRAPTPRSTACLVDDARSCSRRSARSWPTSCYIALTGELSVHLADWPEPAARPTRRSPTEMARGRAGSSPLGRAARTEAKVEGAPAAAPRPAAAPGRRARRRGARAEIADELNVKALEDVDSARRAS